MRDRGPDSGRPTRRTLEEMDGDHEKHAIRCCRDNNHAPSLHMDHVRGYDGQVFHSVAHHAGRAGKPLIVRNADDGDHPHHCDIDTCPHGHADWCPEIPRGLPPCPCLRLGPAHVARLVHRHGRDVATVDHPEQDWISEAIAASLPLLNLGVQDAPAAHLRLTDDHSGRAGFDSCCLWSSWGANRACSVDSGRTRCP